MIDLEEMRAAILTAVADNPEGGDFVYPGVFAFMGNRTCVYDDYNNDCPSCLIGQALSLLGVDVPADMNS